MKQTEAGDPLSQSVAKPYSPVWTQRVKALGIRLMQYVLSTLRNTDRSVPGYVWRALLVKYIVFVPIACVLLVGVTTGIFGSSDPSGPAEDYTNDRHYMGVYPWRLWVELSIWAGIETLTMWPILYLLKRMFGNVIRVAFVSGLIWGGLHAYTAGEWILGVMPVWGFFVYSVCFLEWQRKSKGKAFLMTWLLHTCNNVIASVYTLVLRISGA